MRFYILPIDQGETTCVNFDHVASIKITKTSIEIQFAGTEVPMVVAKSAATLTLVAKGMDLSDNSRDQVAAL